MARRVPAVNVQDEARRASDAESPLLVTIPHAAAMLSVGRTTVYELIWARKLTPIYIGRSVRLARRELEEFVAARLPAGR